MTTELASIVIVGGLYGLFFWPSVDFFGYHPYRKETAGKTVALTFDDGPNPPYTDEILAVLRKHGVVATFFVVGKNLERHPEIGRQILKEGHALGNHTYRHSFLSYLRKDTFVSEIERTQQTIEDATGVRPKLFRFPWLFRSPKLLKLVRSQGLVPVSGRFSTVLETWQPKPEKFAKWALRKVSPGTIMIFHDGHNATGAKRENTIAAVDIFISQLLEQGYTFATVDALLGVPAYRTAT